jgi:hypothetical protein
MLIEHNPLKNMARPEGFEPPTCGFVVISRGYVILSRFLLKSYSLLPFRIILHGRCFPIPGVSLPHIYYTKTIHVLGTYEAFYFTLIKYAPHEKEK